MVEGIKSPEKLWQDVKDCIEDKELTLGPSYRETFLKGNLLFNLARYKFASRLIERKCGEKLSVLELGCNEGFATKFIADTAKKVVGVDLDEQAIKFAQEKFQPQYEEYTKRKNLEFIHDNFLGKRYGEFDAIVSLDVIEHIPKELEPDFMKTLSCNLGDNGFAIIGTPNIAASQYALKTSQVGHVNLYSAESLEEFLSKGFNQVFMFGMNDEMVHTGFKQMSHYLMALACNKK